jgi:glycosyltransferase involved in cell wall biosynthesis
MTSKAGDPGVHITSENEWLERFRREHGRPPRVLHVGNIANNAYNNAKVLNRLGLDCDVICYDYYHMQGCPEWEDADFEGDIGDHFYPDWWSVNLNGFKRPRWFAQGPLRWSIRYLIAKRQRRISAASALWEILEVQRWFLSRRSFSRYQGHMKKIIVFASAVKERLLGTLHRCFRIGLALLTRFLPKLSSESCAKITPTETKFDNQIADLIRVFKERFPERVDKLCTSDFEGYRDNVELWRKLFEYYDIIHANSLDSVHPMLIGKRPYVAYEHGTIRDIPFENDGRGRICLLAYSLADAIYLTNADSVENAIYIGKDPKKLVYGLHGFDEERMRRRVENASSSSKITGRFGFDESIKVFFAPSRHHWRDGFPSWLKGNDRVVKAVKLLAERYPGQFKVVFADWGKEVDLSRELIGKLGVEEFFLWVQPLAKKDLLNAYRWVDCIIDQFVLPCLGGVAMEALAVGHKPVVTYLDDRLMAEFYGETIPLLNCREPGEIAAAMENVLNDPETCAKTVEACRRWMARYHSQEILLNSLVEAYGKALGFAV